MSHPDAPNQSSRMFVSESELRELVAAGVVSRLAAVKQAALSSHPGQAPLSSAYELRALIGLEVAVLARSGGTVRTFASLHTLATFVRHLGADRFVVELGDAGDLSTEAPRGSAVPPAMRSPSPDPDAPAVIAMIAADIDAATFLDHGRASR